MNRQTSAPGNYPDGYFYVELESRLDQMDWEMWQYAIITKFNAGYPGDVIHHDNRAAIAGFERVDPIQHAALVKMLGVI